MNSVQVKHGKLLKNARNLDENMSLLVVILHDFDFQSLLSVRRLGLQMLLVACLFLPVPRIFGQAPRTQVFNRLYQDAQQAMAAGQYSEAIRNYEDLIRSNPRSPQLHFHLGLAHYQKGDYPAAIGALKQSLALQPSFLVAESFLGLSQSIVGNPQASIPLLEKAYRSDGTEIEPELKRLVGLRLAKDYSETGRTLEAEAVYLSLVKHYSNDPDVLYQSFWLHMTRGRETMQKLLKGAPSSYRTHEMLGHLLKRKDNYPAAAEQFRLALNANPTAVGLHYELGIVLLRTTARDAQQQAQREFESELKLHPFHAPSHFQLAEIFLAEQEIDKALEAYHQAIKFNPNHAEARVGLGKIALSKNQPQVAASRCQEALKIDPRSRSAHYVLGKAYLALGQKEEAKAELTLFQELKQEAEEEETRLRSAQMGPMEN